MISFLHQVAQTELTMLSILIIGIPKWNNELNLNFEKDYSRDFDLTEFGRKVCSRQISKFASSDSLSESWIHKIWFIIFSLHSSMSFIQPLVQI